MARTRLVRPGFVRDADLYDAELAWQLPLRVAFLGLWGVTDREGRFAWKPRELKDDALPRDAVEFSDVLDALEAEGFVQRYLVEGKVYGLIPTFKEHQTFHKTEPPSKLPAPVGPPLDPRCQSVVSRKVRDAVAVRDTDTDPDEERQTPIGRSWKPVEEQKLADKLITDAGRNALSAVLAVAGSKTGVVAELEALLSGLRGAQHHCTAEQLDVALSDYVSNGLSSGRWNAQHFRACVRRAMQPAIEGTNGKRPTNTERALAALQELKA